MNAQYPADHKPGMEVPPGGSMCANCEYLANRERGLCGQPDFIKWEGPNKPAGSNKIPLPINRYCSDWFEPAPGTLKPHHAHIAILLQRA